MAIPKLVESLASLPQEDHARFWRFLNSPLHNSRSDIRALYLALKKQRDSDPAQPLEGIFETVFPQHQLNVSDRRHLMRYLMQALERYLAFRAFHTNEDQQERAVLDSLSTLNMSRAFSSASKKRRKKLDSAPVKNAEHHLANYRYWERELNTAATATRPGEATPAYQKMANHLDRFFIISKLQLACGTLAHKQLYQVGYDLGLMEELVTFLENRNWQQDPAIGPYYHAYCMLSRSGEPASHFHELVTAIRKQPGILARGEYQSLLKLAQNFCIKRHNQGEAKYLPELFDLYRFGLSTGLSLENESDDIRILSPFAYKNIVSAGIKLSEFDPMAIGWVREFIDQYKPFLPEANREDYYHFCLAEWHFSRQEFKTIPRLLAQCSFRDSFTALNARVRLIQVYFELGEWQLLEYQLDSFKHFLRRRSGMSYRRENYKQFIRFTRRMMRLEPRDIRQWTQLVSEIEATEILSERDWLLQKLTSIKPAL